MLHYAKLAAFELHGRMRADEYTSWFSMKFIHMNSFHETFVDGALGGKHSLAMCFSESISLNGIRQKLRAVQKERRLHKTFVDENFPQKIEQKICEKVRLLNRSDLIRLVPRYALRKVCTTQSVHRTQKSRPLKLKAFKSKVLSDKAGFHMLPDTRPNDNLCGAAGKSFFV